MSDQHLIDFMDEIGLSAEDILTVFANDELNDAEVRLAAFTSLMGIWKDEREHVRNVSQEMRTFVKSPATAEAVTKVLTDIGGDATLPTSLRVRAASELFKATAFFGESETGPTPYEMTLEELQAQAKKLEGVREEMLATVSDLVAEDEGGGDDGFQ